MIFRKIRCWRFIKMFRFYLILKHKSEYQIYYGVVVTGVVVTGVVVTGVVVTGVVVNGVVSLFVSDGGNDVVALVEAGVDEKEVAG